MSTQAFTRDLDSLFEKTAQRIANKAPAIIDGEERLDFARGLLQQFAADYEFLTAMEPLPAEVPAEIRS